MSEDLRFGGAGVGEEIGEIEKGMEDGGRVFKDTAPTKEKRIRAAPARAESLREMGWTVFAPGEYPGVVSESKVEEPTESQSVETGGEFEVAFFDETDVEIPSQVPAVIEVLPWGQLQDEILDAVITDEDQWDVKDGAVEGLATRLRCKVEDLFEAFEQTDKTEWQMNRAARLLELESIRNGRFNWDKLENAALHKLSHMVQANKIRNVGELLAIARTANQATRRQTGPGGEPMTENRNGVFIQQNFSVGGGAKEEGGLPGPGDLGTITLTLNHRTVQQLGRGKTIDGESTLLAHNAEMLTGKDIPELTKMIDGEVNEP